MLLHFKDVFMTSSMQEKYSREELHSLAIKPSFIILLSDRMKITYKNDLSVENTCFADSRELMAEYRTTFSNDDIMSYILKEIKGTSIYTEHIKIKVPENAVEFFDQE